MIRAVAEDPRLDRLVGEIRATSLSFGQSRGAVGSASIVTGLDTAITVGETMVHIFDDRDGLWTGLVVGKSGSPGSGLQTLSVSGAKWILGRRWLTDPIVGTATELQVALVALSASNTQPEFDVNVYDGVTGPQTGMSVDSGRTVLSIVDEMAVPFDWAVYPAWAEDLDAPRQVIDITPLSGYGTALGLTHGGNCSIVGWATSGTSLATSVIAASTGTSDEVMLAESYVDAPVRLTSWITPSGVTSFTGLQDYAEAAVLADSEPTTSYKIEIDLNRVRLVTLRQGARVLLTAETDAISLDRTPMRIVAWAVSTTETETTATVTVVPAEEYG